MQALKRAAVILGYIFGGLAIVSIGGPLLHAAGETVTGIAAFMGLSVWLGSLYVHRNNVLSFIGFFTMIAAGFSFWLTTN